MPRFSQPMERRLGELEQEYGVASQGRQEEEEGLFGRRGFLGNIQDYYKTDSWGDWWRNLFSQTKERRKEREQYTVYPEWGESNIKNLRSWMEETRRGD